MKSLIASLVVAALPCVALAQSASTPSGLMDQPREQWSYGGMGDVPTKGYWKQPKVSFGYGYDADDPTKGSTGKPTVSMGDSSGIQTPTWAGSPAPRPVVAQHGPTPTHS